MSKREGTVPAGSSGIRLRGVGKAFGSPPTPVLFDVSLDIASGELVSLTGKSGSGKSTLLYLLSALDTPSAGTVEIAGHDMGSATARELHRFRNEHMGFVFQFHYLLPELSAIENVLMPAMKTGAQGARLEHAAALLARFGLGDKRDRLPSQLSGGEQQRVAIARALVMEPRFLFADEPTGNLDSANGALVMEIFREINREKGTTVIYVTHDDEFARLARRQIRLKDGRVVAAADAASPVP